MNTNFENLAVSAKKYFYWWVLCFSIFSLMLSVLLFNELGKTIDRLEIMKHGKSTTGIIISVAKNHKLLLGDIYFKVNIDDQEREINDQFLTLFENYKINDVVEVQYLGEKATIKKEIFLRILEYLFPGIPTLGAIIFCLLALRNVFRIKMGRLS